VNQPIERGSAEWHRRVQMLLQKQVGLIKEHGYTVQGVFPSDEDTLKGDGSDSFFYTIGLFQKRWPELLVLGALHGGSAAGIIKDVYDFWMKNGDASIGDIPADVPGGKLRLNLVQRGVGQQFTVGVRTFKRDEIYEVVQVLWPDNKGCLPDESGYSTEAALKQKILEKI